MIPWVRSSAQSLLHLIYPHCCAACGSDALEESQTLCLRCSLSLPFTGFEQHDNNPVEKIFWGRLPLRAACSILYFTKHSPVQALLHQLKYRGQRDLGLALGREMGLVLRQAARFQPIDLLIPLPLHPRRERRRGYNQAGLLCEGMSGPLQAQVITGVVTRNKATATQTHKSRQDRWQNMCGRFSCIRPEAIVHRHVVLVDDVVTTGATLEACGTELLQAGAASLSVVTLAYTLL